MKAILCICGHRKGHHDYYNGFNHYGHCLIDECLCEHFLQHIAPSVTVATQNPGQARGQALLDDRVLRAD